VASGIGEVEALRPWWNVALRGTPTTIFQDFDWNLLALRTFSEEKPYFVLAESDSSVAILPAVIRNREIGLAGGPLFDYRDAVRAGDCGAFRAALETVAGLNLPMRIFGVPCRGAAEHWSSLGPQRWTAAPFVSAKDSTAESFVARHSRSRRALRRLNDLGATVRRVKGTEERIGRLYREKAKEPGGHGTNVFRDERCLDFMVGAVSLPSTACELFILEAQDKAIAALVTFIDEQVRRFYTTWMDPAWSKHSPGIALLYEATRQTLEQGADCDYMTGEQPYKLRFATGSEPLCRVEASAEQLSAMRHMDAEQIELKAA
jgi:CelD/BcsL family acetyltransferase involved in cellulose biosynthesis